MKVAIDQVRVVIGDTDTAPRDGGMRASRMTYVAGNAMVQACDQLRDNLLVKRRACWSAARTKSTSTAADSR